MSSLYPRTPRVLALPRSLLVTVALLLSAAALPTIAGAQPLPFGIQDITPVAPELQPLRGFRIEAGTECGFDDPAGLYLNPRRFPPANPSDFWFQVTADPRVMSAFDLTAVNFVRWPGSTDRSVAQLWVTGFKQFGETVTTRVEISGAGSTPANFSAFTGITRFTIDIEGSVEAVTALTFDSFTVVNARFPGEPPLLGAAPAVGRLANLSARARTGDGPGAFVIGFTLQGNSTAAAHEVLVRAVGPSLASFGVTGAAANPALRLSRENRVVAQNDDWAGDATMRAAETRSGAFALAAGARDAACVASLEPGTYSVHTTTATGTANGIVLTEIYAAAANARFANFSVRAEVGAGADAALVGFVVTGATPVKLLLRGAGPSLAAFGITAALRDPRLSLYRGATLVGANNDASESARTAGTSVGAFAFPDGSRDAALVLTLPAGVYTAVLNSADEAAGIGLLELYELP